MVAGRVAGDVGAWGETGAIQQSLSGLRNNDIEERRTCCDGDGPASVSATDWRSSVSCSSAIELSAMLPFSSTYEPAEDALLLRDDEGAGEV